MIPAPGTAQVVRAPERQTQVPPFARFPGSAGCHGVNGAITPYSAANLPIVSAATLAPEAAAPKPGRHPRLGRFSIDKLK